MKRMLMSLGVVLASHLIGQAQETSGRPAALGLPRATLGLPRAASDSTPQVVPTQHVEKALPASIPPIVRAQETAPPSPYSFISPPKQMPNRVSVVDENKTDPKVEPINPPVVSSPIASGPAISTTVNAEEPLFAMGETTSPFFNRERWKVSSEYIMWWTNGFATPPLVTTGPAASDGIIGQTGVSVLFGNQEMGSNLQNGYRFGFTRWCGERWGIDGRFYFLGRTGDQVSFSSDTISMLARPFNDINPVRNFSEVIASPGVLTGGVIVESTSYAWGADISGRRKLYEGCFFNVDALIGYRYMNLTETLTITERSVRTDSTSVAPFVDANGTIHGGASFDNFRTSNRFNGGQIGLAGEVTRGRWVFDMRASIAFGVTQGSVDIDGGQTLYYTNGNSVTSRGGLLALDSNIGHHTSQHFAVIPEATFNIGYNITPRCRIFVGYNVIYWSHVLRPGNQIDTTIDSTRIPNFGNTNATLTTGRPGWAANYSDYFAQGLNFGLTFRW